MSHHSTTFKSLLVHLSLSFPLPTSSILQNIQTAIKSLLEFSILFFKFIFFSHLFLTILLENGKNLSLPRCSHQVSVVDGTNEGVRVEVRSGNERWDLQRTFQHFAKLDEQLHKCVFAREFSELPKLDVDSPPAPCNLTRVLSSYTKRLDEALGGNSPGKYVNDKYF